MRPSKLLRWWVFVPFLLVIVVPAWMKLGELWGYDLLGVAQDNPPPRYDSHLLGSFFYAVWWGLCFIAIIPAMLLGPNLFGQPTGIGIGLVLLSLIYSFILVAMRLLFRSIMTPQSPAPDK